MSYNFKKYSHGEADTLGYPYDLDSVMHYDKYAFSANRQPTIVSKKNPNRQLGQRKELSVIDIEQINAMYGCGTTPKPGQSTPAPPTQSPGEYLLHIYIYIYQFFSVYQYINIAMFYNFYLVRSNCSVLDTTKNSVLSLQRFRNRSDFLTSFELFFLCTYIAIV